MKYKVAMILQNKTNVAEFILLGFNIAGKAQVLLLFMVLLGTFVLTVLGNLVIIVITLVDQRLQTPMYFFLRNFSFLEISFTSVVIPKTLANLLAEKKTISLVGCFIQSLFYFILGSTEFFLLSVMSVDRYMAICNPLRYATIMNSRVCSMLVLLSWIGGILFILGPTVVLFRLPFCGPNVINHFFCDNSPLIKLSCADTHFLEFLDFIVATINLIGTLAITAISYISIVSTVLRIPSAKERRKAFSTCSSHIIVVSIFYGSCIFMYLRPTQSKEMDLNKTVAILNTVVTPLLNPFIYTLRNKQVKESLRAILRRVLDKNRD
ncbi:olfactory receptor 49-like [Alligator sinensis]|uniref:Olfactory receptor n=1 Tax=Alligator sinensis TaxID=38654 RepID=A0A1U7SGR8_ALLSI|nr:olfactory receptor 49-like [Alligator sinensis]